MKKPLMLAAIAGAMCSAHAQSSVTLYGIIDTTFARGYGSLTDRTQLLRGGLNSNRLGFRGIEALGGGYSAIFWLEAGFNADDGNGQASNTNNQASGVGTGTGLTFARRSTVSLAAPWGEIRLGRDYVPQYFNLAAGDPFGNVGVGTTMNYAAIITGVTNTRASNMIQYLTPNTLGGFGASLGYYLGENPHGTPTSDDGTGEGFRVWYEKGPLAAGIAYGRTNYAAGDVRQSNAFANWNFGPAKIMSIYSSDRNGALSAHGALLGVSVPVGVGEFKTAYSQQKTSAAGSPLARKFAVGYVHNLSKRTAVYGTVARVNNSGGSAQALNGATTAPNEHSSGFDLGIRHIF
jgi:predicted porin